MQRRIAAPFLIENNVAYFEYPESTFDEPGFLNALTAATGCGLLLDLHNLHTNARNLGVDPRAFLDRLDLDRVVEIHVAGGLEFEGFYLDAHSGASPEPVWALLEEVLPRCRNLCGVVFELFGSWFDELGADGARSPARPHARSVGEAPRAAARRMTAMTQARFQRVLGRLVTDRDFRARLRRGAAACRAAASRRSSAGGSRPSPRRPASA